MRFDVIVGMDDYHLARVRRLADLRSPDGGRPEFRKLGEFDPEATGTVASDVPDPWYGGMDGFERVYAMIARMVPPLVDYLEQAVVIGAGIPGR